MIVNSRTESVQFIASCVLCNDSNSVFIWEEFGWLQFWPKFYHKSRSLRKLRSSSDTGFKNISGCLILAGSICSMVWVHAVMHSKTPFQRWFSLLPGWSTSGLSAPTLGTLCRNQTLENHTPGDHSSIPVYQFRDNNFACGTAAKWR